MHNSVDYRRDKSSLLCLQVFLVPVLCGCRGDLALLVARQSFLFSLMFGTILEDLLSLGSELHSSLSGKIPLCVSNIDTIEYFLTIPSLCLSYVAATNVGLLWLMLV